jgi:hypothetical protein
MRTFAILSVAIVLATLSCFAQQPIAVTTPYGDFQFNAKIINEECVTVPTNFTVFATVIGEIANNTGKDWINLKFTLSYFDENDVEFRATTVDNVVYVGTLKKGEKFSFDSVNGKSVYFKRLRSLHSPDRGTVSCPLHIARVGIKLTSGTIPAKYAFVLLKKIAPEQPIKPPTKTSGRAPVKVSPKPAVIEVVESSDLSFVDNDAEFRFSLSKDQFGFVLRNTSEEPIEIDWNQVAYVDVTGESHKVIHKGVKFNDRDKPLVPTTIPPSARIEDIVLPTDYVYFVEGGYGSWQNRQLFPDGDKAALYKGQTFTLFMPVKVNGTVKNYTFKFKIADVEL